MNEDLKDQMASSTQQFIAFLGNHLNDSAVKQKDKRKLDEDVSTETATKKRALDDEVQTKQAELNLLRINRELQEEQQAIANGSSSISKLTLARERVQYVTQFVSAGMTKAEEVQMADEVISTLV